MTCQAKCRNALSLRALGRLLFATLLLLIGLSVTNSFYQTHREQTEDARQHKRDTIAQTAGLIADRVAQAVALGDAAATRDDLMLISTVPELQEIEVFTFSGAGLIAAQHSADGITYREQFERPLSAVEPGFHRMAESRHLAFVQPVKLDRATVGWLRLTTDAAYANRVITQSFSRFLLETALVWVLLILVGTIAWLQTRLQSRLERRLKTDEITGELSRYGFKTDFADGRRRDHHALYLVDVQSLKAINDSHGVRAGDRVLAALTQSVRSLVPGVAAIARLGGDDFAILVPARRWPQVQEVGKQLMAAIGAIKLDEFADIGEVRASVGATLLAPDDNLSQRLSEADMALGHAKDPGVTDLVVADTAFLNESRQRGAFVTDREIRDGLRKGEFRYHIQPLVETTQGKTIGYEALIRWQKGDALRSPAFFLDKFKEVIRDPEMYRLVVAMRQQLSARAARNGVSLLAYNIRLEDLAKLPSAERFRVDFGANMGNHLRIMVEVSESGIPRTLRGDLSAFRDSWERIRGEDSVLALDDFGALESNLSRLRKLDIDYVKIDKALTNAVDVDPKSQAILRAIVQLADELGIIVIAEGIERRTQAEIISDLGITLQQGFYHGHPQPAEHYLD